MNLKNNEDDGILIRTRVFKDLDSVKILLDWLDDSLFDKNIAVEVLILNDSSTNLIQVDDLSWNFFFFRRFKLIAVTSIFLLVIGTYSYFLTFLAGLRMMEYISGLRLQSQACVSFVQEGYILIMLFIFNMNLAFLQVLMVWKHL